MAFSGVAGCGGCACEACVCAADPSCCSDTWDLLCAARCQYDCGGDCGLSCGDGLCYAPSETCETCADDCGDCPTGGVDPTTVPGCFESNDGGCDGCPCEAVVCAEDPDCCNDDWDEDCTQLCFEEGHCGTDPGCVPRDEEGCDGCACEAAVCAEESGCCTDEWNDDCVELCQEAGSCQGTPTDPTCGDGACNGDETCEGCPGDCGACAAVCGDGACNGAEACATCPGDCGVCAGACGDGACDAGEDCASCPGDCGACPVNCGDDTCDADETCDNCPADCTCSCGDGNCNGAETILTCHGDCAPGWMSAGGADFHGQALYDDVNSCGMCHGGATLNGGVRSCELCHPGWKTNCTFCHGGMDNQLGSPPWGVDDETETSARQVGAHTAHVSASATKVAYDCSMCHVVPTDIFSAGHIDGDGFAELSMSDCNGGSYASPTCSSVYCHGNGKSTNAGGSATWTGGGMGCQSCHPSNNLSNTHGDHGFACGTCHGLTVSGSSTIIDPVMHINCVKDVSGSFNYNASNRQCSSISCHGSETW